MPSLVRAAWDDLSRDQRKLIRKLRDVAALADCRGTHPTSPDFAAMVQELCANCIALDMARCIAWLTTPAHVAACVRHLHKDASDFAKRNPGTKLMGIVCRDDPGHFAAIAKASAARVAQDARELDRQQRAADAKAAADKLREQAAADVAALEPYGEVGVGLLIDRAIRRMADPAAQESMRARRRNWTRNGRFALVESPTLRQLALDELTQHGPPNVEDARPVGGPLRTVRLA